LPKVFLLVGFQILDSGSLFRGDECLSASRQIGSTDWQEARETEIPLNIDHPRLGSKFPPNRLTRLFRAQSDGGGTTGPSPQGARVLRSSCRSAAALLPAPWPRSEYRFVCRRRGANHTETNPEAAARAKLSCSLAPWFLQLYMQMCLPRMMFRPSPSALPPAHLS